MDSHNEKKDYLFLGKKKIDVSNIPYGRILHMKDLWDEAVSSDEEDLTKREVLYNLIEEIGIYLIRQPLKVLARRYPLLRAIKEYIKRLFITKKFLKNLNEQSYEVFEDFVYQKMMGKKKANLEMKKGLLDVMTEMAEEVINTTNLNLETYLALLRTSHKGIVEQSMNSTPDQ